MSFLSYLGIALKDSFYYRSRLIGSILGALIAVSFISGAVISVDDISGRFFEDTLKDMEYHLIFGTGYVSSANINVDTAAQRIKGVDGVRKVLGVVNVDNYLYNENGSATIEGITSETAEHYFGTKTTLPLDGKDVIIPNDLARRLGVSKGDEFIMSVSSSYINYDFDIDYEKERFRDISSDPAYPGYDKGSFNYTFKVFDIIDRVGKDSDEGYYDSTYYYESKLVMGVGGLREFIKNLKAIDPYGYVNAEQTIMIRISSSYFKNLEDESGTNAQVSELVRDINQELQPLGYTLWSNYVKDLYSMYKTFSYLMKVFFIVLSVPLLLISFYLLSAGSKVGMEERIREIGLMKIKGASKGQVITILLIESLIYGMFGGLLGLVVGSIMSLFFTARVFGFRPLDILSRGSVPIPGIGLMVLAFMVVPAIILIMRLSSIFKMSNVPLLEALGRATILEKQKRYRITTDLMILTFTSLIILLMVYFNYNPPNNFYLGMIAFILMFLSPLAVLFLPFLLILSISRLTIIGFDFTLNILSNIGRLIIDDLFPLVKANMVFQRKRIATLTILVTTVIAFGILISSLDASRTSKVEADVTATIPSDLLVCESIKFKDHTNNISDLPSLKWMVIVDIHNDITIQSQYDYYYYSPRIISFNSTEYQKRIDVPDSAVMDGKGPEGMVSSGEVPVLINSAMRSNSDINIGYTFWMTSQTYYEGIPFNQETIEPFKVKVVGIVSYLPGTRSTIDYGSIEYTDHGRPYVNIEDKYEEPAIYLDSRYLPSNMIPNHRTYLIDTKGKEEKAINDIDSIAWNDTKYFVLSKEKEIHTIKDNLIFSSIQMLLDMEYLFVITAVTGGVMLFMIVSTSSRRREFAEILARGSTRTQVLRLVITEGVIILAASLLIGTFIGMIVSIAFQHLFTFDLFSMLEMILMPSSRDEMVDTGGGIVFPPSMLLLHLLAIISVIGASGLTSWIASRVDVASSLRLRTS
ncbi:MAG: FtsX-like permease family protein [Candidatus Thermoplasmatota archaeon]|nr:FtsX-like permease family protein [Candidatus Thermoplasmatota archaeon]